MGWDGRDGRDESYFKLDLRVLRNWFRSLQGYEFPSQGLLLFKFSFN